MIVNWPITLNNEGWVVAYNKCLNTLLIGGGGTEPNSVCLRMGMDTSLAGTLTGNGFNGATGSNNDLARMLIDDNGDMYSFFTSISNISGTANKIFKSAPPYNTFSFSQLRTTSSFEEVSSIPGANIGGNYMYTNRLNVMDMNGNYLYFFDGKNLEARSKANGALLSSIVVSASYFCGSNFPGVAANYQNEGIAVDDCDNVYVGGQNLVHVFNFNGITFNVLPTMAVPGNVYDVMLDTSKHFIYVVGNGFVSSLPALSCNPNPLLISPTSSGACNGYGTASVNVSGGVPPYTYLWSNGATTSSINAPAGMYTVTVTNGGCQNSQSAIDTVTISSTSNISAAFGSVPSISCDGLFMQFIDSSLSATSWNWNFGLVGSSTDQNPGIVFPVNGYYNVTLIVTNNSCADTASKTIAVGDLFDSGVMNQANVFTPNGDGNNDCFLPPLGSGSEHLKACLGLEIFDRWGSQIFSATSVPNTGWESVCWNGNNAQGKPAVNGTYYYIATLGESSIKGYLTLAR